MEILIIFILVLGAVLLHSPIQSWFEKIQNQRHLRRFHSQENFYHSVIINHVKFYKRLSFADQQKFLLRTYLFRQSKKFHYIEVEPTAEMPILVSAMAVQLTFGLDKFKLNFFRDIYVLRDDYHYGFYSRPFQGHVDHSGIYLSWDNFLKGIKGLTPNCNVGLHEMGHALAYVNFITQTEEDRHFKKEFKNYSTIARPIFNAMQEGHKNILGEYAGTNYHEFWAVSVEVFFENPIRFKRELPDLYDALVRLLKQDPVQTLMESRIAA